MPKTAKVKEKIMLGIIAVSFFFFLHFLLSPSATTTETAIHGADSNMVGVATPAPTEKAAPTPYPNGFVIQGVRVVAR